MWGCVSTVVVAIQKDPSDVSVLMATLLLPMVNSAEILMNVLR